MQMHHDPATPYEPSKSNITQLKFNTELRNIKPNHTISFKTQYLNEHHNRKIGIQGQRVKRTKGRRRGDSHRRHDYGPLTGAEQAHEEAGRVAAHVSSAGGCALGVCFGARASGQRGPLASTARGSRLSTRACAPRHPWPTWPTALWPPWGSAPLVRTVWTFWEGRCCWSVVLRLV